MQWAAALILFIPLLKSVVLGRRKPNIIEETQTKTTLHILDDNIVEYLSKPSSSTSKIIFIELREYNDNFKEIIDGFKERKFRFVRIAHVIYDKGGPNFMKLRIDAPMMLKINGWTMNDMGELYHLLKTTHRLWLDFKEIYEEVKTAVKGNWTQLKSTFHSTPAPMYNISAMLYSIMEPTEIIYNDTSKTTTGKTMDPAVPGTSRDTNIDRTYYMMTIIRTITLMVYNM